MTKTFTKTVSHCSEDTSRTVMLLLDATLEISLVWKFEFGSLEFV